MGIFLRDVGSFKGKKTLIRVKLELGRLID